MFPEYLVNRWIGHTQQVAEAHYTQVLPSDFTDAYNAEKKVGKTVGKTVGEHAGMGCYGIETEKRDFAANPCISSTCNDSEEGARGAETPQVTRQGLEPWTREPKSLVLPITPPGSPTDSCPVSLFVKRPPA